MSRQLFEEARKVLTQEAAVKLDPVGQEDKDVDNDGDADKTDSYLKKRRGAISAAIAKSKNESALSDEDLAKLKAILGEMKKKEEMEDEEEDEEDEMEDDEKKMKNEGMQKAQVPPKGPKPEEVPAYMRKGNARQKFPLELADLKRKNEETELQESDGPVVWKKGAHSIEKMGDTSFALYVGDKKMKTFSSLDAAKGYAMKKEEVEQANEAKLSPAGKAAVKDVTKKIGAKKLSQTKAIVALAKLNPKNVKEETEQEEYELIEKLNFNVSQNPSYQDYIKAALTIAECKSFAELSEEDQQYIISEMEVAFRENNTDFILEAESLSDMNDTVQRLRKAGHKIEDMGRDFKGNPFYVYVDKGSMMRRKVTYKGNQKMTQNMGKAQPEKEEDNQ